MPNTQTTTFKGARYIVKFHDPIQWSANTAYEAIEAVQNNGFTYISKQPVPVGVQISNTDFWLLWADPNAQMEQLRQLVEQYELDVETVVDSLNQKQRKMNIAIIGDSYTAGANYYFPILQTLLADVANIDRYATGGIGFVREATSYSSGLNFIQKANDIVASGKTYDIVLVYGGINDFHYGTTEYSNSNRWGYIPISNVTTAIDTVTSILNNYAGTANAHKIALLNSTMYTNINDVANEIADDFQAWCNFYATYAAHLKYNGWETHGDAVTWLWWDNSTSFTNVPGNLYESDLTHPNAKGSKIIAQYIASVLTGGYNGPNWKEFRSRNSIKVNSTRNINGVFFNQAFHAGKWEINVTVPIVNTITSLDIDCAIPDDYIFMPIMQTTYCGLNGYCKACVVAVDDVYGEVTADSVPYIDSDGHLHFKCSYANSSGMNGRVLLHAEYYLPF